jgi:hypothetical protein
MTYENLKDLGRHIAERTKQFVTERLTPVHVELSRLSRRVDALEGKSLARPRTTFRGEWEAVKSYGAGDSVTRGNQLWIAHGENRGCRPGESLYWQLAIKHEDDLR